MKREELSGLLVSLAAAIFFVAHHLKASGAGTSCQNSGGMPIGCVRNLRAWLALHHVGAGEQLVGRTASRPLNPRVFRSATRNVLTGHQSLTNHSTRPRLARWQDPKPRLRSKEFGISILFGGRLPLNFLRKGFEPSPPTRGNYLS